MTMLFRLDEFIEYAKANIDKFYIPYRIRIDLTSSELEEIEKSLSGKEGLNKNIIDSYYNKSKMNCKEK